MPSVKYLIELSGEERKILRDIVTKQNLHNNIKSKHTACFGLWCQQYMTVSQITDAYYTTATTVQNVRTYTITVLKQQSEERNEKLSGTAKSYR